MVPEATLFGFPIVEYDREDSHDEAYGIVFRDWEYFSGRIKLELTKREGGGWILSTSEPMGADILKQFLDI